ncbi:MAG: molybdopterin-dependent oxidoreductase [Deltaproteobacteria bacterium]|nr:molybdopterin-dependent oxidoreductase [Deltaproteobacteria bacterium]
MGCEPDNLTGFVSIEEGKRLFEDVWGTSVPTMKGLNLMQMMDAAADGRLKALWAIGYDVFLTNPNAHATRQAMRSLELIIVQDMFLNETARWFGSVFLPVSSSFEKDGTFMNAERRIQRVRKVIEPVAESKPDWEIICTIASVMGKGQFFDFHCSGEIWNEIRTVWKAGSGVSYERIEKEGLQWPCPSEESPGTQVLHTETFPIGKRAALRRVEYSPTTELTTEDFPFLLVTGRTLYHFNAGTMTLRTKNTVLHPADFLNISPEDAKRLRLQDWNRVKVRSHYGEAVLPIRINHSVKSGELFATFHTTEVFLNCVTSPHRDSYESTPEYKVTAVQIEKV